MTPISWLLVVVVFLASVAITAVVLRSARKFDLLDEPNARSMHDVTTPRGGGLSIVISFLLAVAFYAATGTLDGWVASGFIIAGVLVAGIGIWDDLRGLSAQLRLVIHFIAAMVLIAAIGATATVPSGLPMSILLFAAAVVGSVWLLNLYNFMDGVDGIAATETLFVCLGAALLMTPDSDVLLLILLLLAAATAGFAVFNWPPAKIFMGDVASGFIGLMLAGLIVFSVVQGVLSIWIWLLLLAMFMVDATVTLVHRAWRGERVHEAHRQHAYQHLARRSGHRRTVLVYLAVNILLLLPLAFAVHRNPALGPLVTPVAYAALAVAVLRLGAGFPDRGEVQR